MYSVRCWFLRGIFSPEDVQFDNTVWEHSQIPSTRYLFITCLKHFLYSLQLVSTVNSLLNILHSFAPYPFRPPQNQNQTVKYSTLHGLTHLYTTPSEVPRSNGKLCRFFDFFSQIPHTGLCPTFNPSAHCELLDSENSAKRNLLPSLIEIMILRRQHSPGVTLLCEQLIQTGAYPGGCAPPPQNSEK